MTARHRIVRVPASSANLGPGYDVMAAAVSMYLELEVREAGAFSIDMGEINAPNDRGNLVVRAFERLHPADEIAFTVRSEIPLARGLGSSAAAIVAGLYAADHLYELGLSKAELLAHASQVEGHPDNVAASIYGGFVVCNLEGKRGDAEAFRFDPPDGLEAIVVIPADEVSTMQAREAIPESIPTGDAVANISATATLVLGLQMADLDLVADGLRDRIHQPRRRELYPRSMELVDAAREIGALGATISGAGPTVLVWTTWQDAGKVAEALEERASGWAEVRRLPFTPLGADVPEL